MIIDEEYWPDLDVTAAWEALKDAVVPIHKAFVQIGRTYGHFQQINKAMQKLEEPKQDDYVLVPTPLPWSDPASNPLEDILSYGPKTSMREPAIDQKLKEMVEAFGKAPTLEIRQMPSCNPRPHGPYREPFAKRGMHR